MVKPAQAKHHRPIRTSNAPTNPERQISKDKTHMRDNATIRRLKMYNSRPVRDRNGKFIGGQFMSRYSSFYPSLFPLLQSLSQDHRPLTPFLF